MEADFFAGKGIDKTVDKVLSTKSSEEIKKILVSFRENQSGGDQENLQAKENQYV
jgi:hypothetical protein